ncbi:hypothetical protein PENSUB_7219 [Penicillium subrubescens]|uniref:Uncharacterized protein n=1 Tax=Penicillium subrubescens TaxID=1316194 RepID=A0A1Q5TP35_9EURO|nr:hypothetical protein PENSUB_7219 [Penicillium subrubescens]
MARLFRIWNTNLVILKVVLLNNFIVTNYTSFPHLSHLAPESTDHQSHQNQRSSKSLWIGSPSGQNIAHIPVRPRPKGVSPMLASSETAPPPPDGQAIGQLVA